MQWDDREHAGFTSGTPWLKINPNYPAINVKQSLNDPHSVLHYYQKLIRLRKENPVIVYGRYELMLDAHEQIYAYTRTLDKERLLVMLNFSADTPVFALPTHIEFTNKALLISNYPIDREEGIDLLTLRPFEARVYCLM
jgi:oligo-1,6-glucosidase